MIRMNKRAALALFATAAVVFVAVGGLVGWCAREAVQNEAAGSDCAVGTVLDVTVACEGWTERNVGLGAFVSGNTASGSPFDEQLAFSEPGSQEVEVPEGAYQVVPRVPQLMLEDGIVVAVDGPVACRCPAEGGKQAVELFYDAVDMARLDDEELARIAADSFSDADAVAGALERAMSLRDKALESAGENGGV